MSPRALFVFTAAAAVAIILLLPGEAQPLDADREVEIPAAPPANRIGANGETGVAAAAASVDLAAKLSGASSISDALSAVAPEDAARLADARSRAPGSLEDELTALHARLGFAPTESELASARAADPGVAAATARLLSAVVVAAELHDEAFADLTAEERAALPRLLDEALDAAGDRHAPESDRAAAIARLDEVAFRVDEEKIAAAGLVVARAVDDVLRAPPTTNGATGDVLLTLAGGMVHVGGPASTSYDGFNILILDLGGSDLYEDTAAGVDPTSPFPVSVVVDLDGNDVYSAATVSPTAYAREHVQGAGMLGVGVLVDAAGNDAYSSGIALAGVGDVTYTLQRSQGFGALGAGALVDLGGDDLYASSVRLTAKDARAAYSTSLVQAAAAHGVGVLLDASGTDGYSSWNSISIDVERGKAFSTWSAQYCQGAVASAGAAALVEGTLPEGVFALGRSVDPQALLQASNDAYNSYNSIVTVLATTESGFTGTTDGLAQFFNLNCQGTATAGPDANASRLLPNRAQGLLSLGVLADAYGHDAFASGNFVKTFGVNRGGVQDSCAGCHLGADVVVKDSQGASAEVGFTIGRDGQVTPQPARGGHVGVMAEALGNDQYNSYNQIEVDGVRFELRPGQTNGVATYTVDRSIGHAGSPAASEDGHKECRTSSPAFGDACVRPPCGASGGELGDGVGADLPALGVRCLLGVHVDLEGNDVYNSGNYLAAANADSNWETFRVARSLGTGEQAGIGVHVDGPVGGYAFVGGVITCSSRLFCASPFLYPYAYVPLSAGYDWVNSGNYAAGALSFQIGNNLGRGEGGYGFAADVSPGATLFALLYTDLGNPTSTVPFIFASAGSTDYYDSWNTCPAVMVDRSSFGSSADGVGVFVEAAGSDHYVNSPGCLSAPVDWSFGSTEMWSGMVALFVDAGGYDSYPAVAPTPGPLLFLPPGPANDAGWENTPLSLVRVAWGADVASAIT